MCSLQVVLNWRGALHKYSSSLLREFGIAKDLDGVLSCRTLSYTANMFHHFQKSMEQAGLLAVCPQCCHQWKYSHVTPLLHDVLHWLPVPLRIEYKVCLLVYKSIHGAAPGYLRDYCIETYSSASGLRLWSTDKRDLRVRRMKTQIGDRAFSAAGPSYWNSLPSVLRATDSVDSFKTGLKTYLFSRAYSAVSWL